MLQQQTPKALEQARHYGIKIHELISKIHYADELESVIEDALFQGEIGAEEKKELQQLFEELIYASILSPYFSRGYSVLNEQDIILPKTKILRPDRLAYNQEEVIVIDYKTGAKKEKTEVKYKNMAIGFRQFLSAQY